MAGNHYSNKVKIILQAGDLLFLNLAFMVSSYITTQSLSFLPKDQTFTFLIMINFIWYVLASYSDLYNIGIFIRIDRNIYKALFITTLHYAIVALILYLINIFKYTTHNMFIFYVTVYYSIFAGKILLLLSLKYLRRHKYYIRNVVILGGGKIGDEIKSLIASDYSFGYRYLGTFDDTPSSCQFKSAVTGSINDFKTFALEIKLDYSGSIPIMLLRQEPLESYRNRFLKRSFDILFSLFVIVFILSWLIPLLGLLIKLESKGPIFFTQLRTGLNNKEFTVLKFRIMHENVEADIKHLGDDDPRLTRLGGFLRKMNIDEMPQF